MLKHKKKEESRQAKLKADREKVHRARQNKIADLFSKAETQLHSTRLKAGYQSFQEILKLVGVDALRVLSPRLKIDLWAPPLNYISYFS